MKEDVAIDLVCLDFDGTIMTYDEEPGFFHPEIIDLLNEAEKQGVRWCTNSGRDFAGQKMILEASCRKGLTHIPDALIASESYLYNKRNGGFDANMKWNQRAVTLQRRFHRALQDQVKQELAGWHKEYALEQVYLEETATVFLVGGNDGEPAQFQQNLEPVVALVGNGYVSRNGGWIAALPKSLSKGSVLRNYVQENGLKLDRVLAVGDHLNDLTMLDGSAAAHVGCPADAQPEIISAVEAAGGRVAAAQGPLGTAEILRFYI
jgi:hydroxymethylpyrimidine pyrophosphatase-like HAD family hydrolase